MSQVSLILTLLNEEKGLPSFLDSLSAQTVMPEEVVVVDGGSSDRTVDVLRDWADSRAVNIVIQVSPGANISEGRNEAITLATHDVIAVTDAGTMLDPNWLGELTKKLSAEVDVVSGFFEPFGTTWTEQILAAVTVPLLEEIDPASFLPSSRSVLMRRSAWEGVGGYPEWLDYCEDLVFDIRMKESGATFVFAPRAIARWSVRPSFRSYMKQYFRYARGDGKAGLWRKRHAARYGAYAVGGAVLFSRPSRTATGVLTIGFATYVRKFITRAWVRRSTIDSHRSLTLAAVPVIVVLGDVAKMAGYPAGVRWRSRELGQFGRRSAVGQR